MDEVQQETVQQDDVKNKAVRGSMMAGAVTMTIRPLRILSTVVLARLLNPSDFGSVALAMLLVSSSNLFLDFGMSAALIHTKADKARASFQAFVVTSLTGLLASVVAFTSAESIAVFLGDITITPILRWLTILILLLALNTIPDALLKKDMHFGRVSALLLLPEVLYIFIVTGLAFAGFGVWSLVYARIISTILLVVGTWTLAPGWSWIRPRHWDWALLWELMRYGTQSMVNGVVAYFHSNWDDWLVGRVLGTAQLGYYDKAYTISNQTLASLSRSVINTVFFPSYTHIRDDLKRLTRVYMKSLRFVLALMIPVSLGLLVTAPIVVPIVFGTKWLPMVPVLQVYSVLVLTRPISSNTYPLFMALGLPSFNLRAGILLSIVMVPLALWGLQYGIVGVASAVVAAHFVAATYNVFQVRSLLPGTGNETLRALVAPAVAGIAMVAAVQVAKAPLAAWAGGQQTVWTLLMLIGIGILVYGAVSMMTQRSLFIEFTGVVSGAFKGSRRRRRRRVAGVVP